MISNILKDFPYLELGAFISEELRFVLGRGNKEYDRLLHLAKVRTEILTKMLPEDQITREVCTLVFATLCMFSKHCNVAFCTEILNLLHVQQTLQCCILHRNFKSSACMFSKHCSALALST